MKDPVQFAEPTPVKYAELHFHEIPINPHRSFFRNLNGCDHNFFPPTQRKGGLNDRLIKSPQNLWKLFRLLCSLSWRMYLFWIKMDYNIIL